MLAAVLLVGACGTGSPFDSRQNVADRIAKSAQFESIRFDVGAFDVLGYRRYAEPGTTRLSIYIEGDGLAWNAFGTAPTADPTPRDPVALRLATLDDAPNILYLARPCQYPGQTPPLTCGVRYWTSHRFAEEVVATYADIVDRQIRASGASDVRLVGYSGGGVLAALIATRIDPKPRLVTIAAPLDHAHWTRVLEVSPMEGSLNPVDSAAQLSSISQIHIVSTRDEVVPQEVVQQYLDALEEKGTGTRRQIVRVDSADHWCCWPDLWPDLLREIDREGG